MDGRASRIEEISMRVFIWKGLAARRRSNIYRRVSLIPKSRHVVNSCHSLQRLMSIAGVL
jgi:hypothetical protein